MAASLNTSQINKRVTGKTIDYNKERSFTIKSDESATMLKISELEYWDLQQFPSFVLGNISSRPLQLQPCPPPVTLITDVYVFCVLLLALSYNMRTISDTEFVPTESNMHQLQKNFNISHSITEWKTELKLVWCYKEKSVKWLLITMKAEALSMRTKFIYRR
jgi:hypothetical protein